MKTNYKNKPLGKLCQSSGQWWRKELRIRTILRKFIKKYKKQRQGSKYMIFSAYYNLKKFKKN